ncbi:ribonuclease G [Bifidobacterium goeldii]|uniref:Ribonuclease E n=1 Tax=Bifidobacterium goeldii TaxID=2306975 RepID=A0A430FC73_9BIFI|nr:Rne/Rng family ribonuclease [Bifidobacterium goeldii]RSX50408.1 ribonuclease G [Bifidobacterium goeldii]
MQRIAGSIVPSVNDNGSGISGTAQHNANNSNNADDSAQPRAAQGASSASTPAPRRRRGGRRVVRGAGAAGAALQLKVEDHSAPLFEEPNVREVIAAVEADEAAARERRAQSDRVSEPAESSAAPAADDDNAVREPSRRIRSRRRAVSMDDESVETPRRSRRRSRIDAADTDSDTADRARRSDSADAPDLTRAFDAIESLPATEHRARPMTSVLFQEPVLPLLGRAAHDDRETSDDEYEDLDRRIRDTRESRSDRRSRRRSTAVAHIERIEDDDLDTFDDSDASDARDINDVRADRETRDQDERLERGRRNRSGRANRAADNDRNADRSDTRDRADRAADSSDAADRADDRRDTRDTTDSGEETSRSSSRRNRRLNAQERRAAAEVEQIEEDLELDDISYAPIDEEEAPAESTGRRRRRRSRANRAEEPRDDRDDRSSDESEVADEPTESPRRRSRDDDDEESTVTRRRRRRRSRSGEEPAEEEPMIRRSRKQQYIDEITDVEGSTRLEAKKQRRRDNRRERSRQSQLTEQDFLARRENVDRLMVVRERGHHTQISVIEDNILVEHYVSDIQEVATVGNIYLGRVQNVLPSMEAAFVDIGQSRNGVLYAGEVNWDATRLEGQPRRIELAFKSGDPVLVQVTKDPIGHKGARLTSQVTLAGRFLVLVPSGGMTGVSRKLSERERSRLKNIVSKIAPKDMGVIIRTAAEGASEEAIVKDLESLTRQWERISSKREEFWHGKRPKLLQGEPDVAIRVVRDIFNDDFNQLIVEGDKVYDRIEEYLDTMAPDLKEKLVRWNPEEHQGKDVFDKWQIDSQLRKGMERQVYLPSGGSIVIDRTEAMTTIDVNTGRFIGRGKSLEETVTRCNLEAAEEIARQLRLRDIGGMVMIDFVDMVMPANRDLVLRRLVECLARDRTKHQVAEVTSLGLVQMTRKRIGQGLVEAFSEECPTCRGRGFILHDEPTVSADYDDPYALKGGDPFVKTNKHGRGTDVQVPQGSSADVKAKLAQIAAAAVAANNADDKE